MTHEHANGPVAKHGSPLEGLHMIYAAIFIVFLLVALASQLFHWNWRTSLPGAEDARSVWSGVQSAAHTLMSQLT